MTIVTFMIFIILLIICLIVAIKSNLIAIAIIGYCLLIILSAIYLKRGRKYFTDTVELVFDLDGLTINRYSRRKKTLVTYKKYNWVDIKAYKLYFTINGYTNLDLYSKKICLFKEYTFVDKPPDDAQKEISVYNLFMYGIRTFNRDQNIKLKRGFLITKMGLVTLEAILILDVIFIILMFKFKPSNFSYSLLSLAFILPLFLKRKQDKITYQKIINYEPGELFLQEISHFK